MSQVVPPIEQVKRAAAEFEGAGVDDRLWFAAHPAAELRLRSPRAAELRVMWRGKLGVNPAVLVEQLAQGVRKRWPVDLGPLRAIGDPDAWTQRALQELLTRRKRTPLEGTILSFLPATVH